MRSLRAADYAAADAAREDAESSRWVNALPQPDGDRLVAFFEQSRIEGRLLHFAIAAAETDEYYGEVLIFLRTAEAGPDNVASQRVAAKAGYEYEGTLRSTKVIRGSRVDCTLWSLLPR